MAQRPDELDETTRISTTETDAIAVGNSAAAAIAATGVQGGEIRIEKRSHESETVTLTGVEKDADTNAEGTPSDEITPETEQIREQIEETRSNLGDTINAIQEKLSFSNISEQVKDEVSEHITSALNTAKDSVYDATLGKVGTQVGTIMSYVNKGMDEFGKTTVGRSAYQQPLALSLIGLGVGMILVNGLSKKDKTRKNYRYEYTGDEGRNFGGEEGRNDYERRSISSSSSSSERSTFDRARSSVGDYAGQAYEGAGSAVGAVGDYAGKAGGAVSDYTGKAVGAVGDYAGKVSETVGDYAGKVSETVSDYAGSAYEQVGNLGSKAKDYAGSAQDKYEHYMDENPLAVGAVVVAIGAAVGMAFPSTKAENRLMGDARENLMNKAQETAREAIGKVQEAAGNVTETVKQVAGEVSQSAKEGAGDITQKVKEGAETVAQNVKDEAKNQGLTDAK